MRRHRGVAEATKTTSVLVSGAPRRVGGVLALFVLVLLAALSARDLAPPPSRPATAPEDSFSAERAADVLEPLASTPRPLGTPAGDAARGYLLAELKSLGVEPRVQSALVESPLRSGTDGSTLTGQVDNIVATLPGTEPTGSVLLVAHYDSTMNSPGAADDGASVAAILETIRALQAGPPLRNDVVILLTDGEEPGLLGAQAFIRDHDLADRGGVVLNLEAGGSQGPSTLFEASPGNACVVDAFATAPHPYGDSATASFYALTSHNTDFTVFTNAGFAGLNSGFFRGNAEYHTPQDSMENLSRDSLQHQGANLLGLTRSFGELNLDFAAGEECGESVFFSAFGEVIRYPAALALPLALIGQLGLIAAIAIGRRRGLVSLRRVLIGAAAAFIPLVLSGTAAFALWEVLVAASPGYADLGMGDPYRAVPYRVAIIALSAAVLLGWYSALRDRVGPISLALGSLLWPTAIGLVLAAVLPGASFLLALPVLGGMLSLLAAMLLPERSAAWGAAGLVVGAAGTVIILPQLAWDLLSSSGGIRMASMPAVLLIVLCLPLLSVLELGFASEGDHGAPSEGRTSRRRGLAAAAAIALVAGGLTGVGLAADRFDAEHPRPSHLHYVQDANDGTSTWISRDTQPSAWTCSHVDCTAAAGPSELRADFPGIGGGDVRTGPAASAEVAAPTLTILEDRREGSQRVLELRLESSRDAAVLSLFADRPVVAASIDGTDLVDTSAPQDGPWAFGLEIHDPVDDGATVVLRFEDPEPLQLRVVTRSYGLDDVPGFTPRPAGIGIAMAPSDVVSVGRTFVLEE